MADDYAGRGQTAAKHFILRRYLQALAFKLLHGGHPTLTYVDAFSGPWRPQRDDFRDTSFMIAIEVLRDAQQQVAERSGVSPEIRCFFVEKDPSSYSQLQAAVMAHHSVPKRFHVHTFNGAFADAVSPIMKVVGSSFVLTFIDPTGWTGYEFPKIQPLLRHPRGEVLVNYMKPFIDRFTNWDEPTNKASFDGILGGPGWETKLDSTVPREEAAYRLFSRTLKEAGAYRHVMATPIQKDSGEDSFRIVYGTRNDEGLKAYRDAEVDALKNQDERRYAAQREADDASGIVDMFADYTFEPPTKARVAAECREAREWLVARLKALGQPVLFENLWPGLLARHMIRWTDARTICKELADEGVIVPTWKQGGSRRLKPEKGDLIQLVDGAQGASDGR